MQSQFQLQDREKMGLVWKSNGEVSPIAENLYDFFCSLTLDLRTPLMSRAAMRTKQQNHTAAGAIAVSWSCLPASLSVGSRFIARLSLIVEGSCSANYPKWSRL